MDNQDQQQGQEGTLGSAMDMELNMDLDPDQAG